MLNVTQTHVDKNTIVCFCGFGRWKNQERHRVYVQVLSGALSFKNRNSPADE